ncbi:uncharacterized protein RCH25_049714 [Pelodytes ibericus]
MASLDPSILLAQRLAANDKKTRDRAVRKLRGYLRARSGLDTAGFTEEEFCKIWKGLFYCMWMQDKPLLQEDLAHTIVQLINTLHTKQSQHLFLRTFWQTLNREWNGIDRLRLDKFYTLSRMVLHQSVVLVREAQWEESLVGEFLSLLVQEVLPAAAPRGVQFHLIDIYLDELAKVGAAELPADLNLKLIEPFCKMAAKTKDPLLLQAILTGIFQSILDHAPFAIEDLMKEVKMAAGDNAAEGSDENLEEDIGPVLQFDYQALADRLFALASRKNTPAHNRKRLYRLVKQFRDLAEGEFPQDEFPDEVSTDEDDDEFSSWRFRMRQKKAAQAARDLDPAQAEKKQMPKRKRQTEDSSNVDSPQPQDAIDLAPIKKKCKKDRLSMEETPHHPAINGATADPQSNHLKKRRRGGLIRLPTRTLLLARRRRILQYRGRSRKVFLPEIELQKEVTKTAPQKKVAALSTGPQKKVAALSTGPQKKVAALSTGPQKKVAALSTGPQKKVAALSTPPQKKVAALSTPPQKKVAALSTPPQKKVAALSTPPQKKVAALSTPPQKKVAALSTPPQKKVAALSTPPQKKVAALSTPPQKKVAALSTPPQKKVAALSTPPQKKVAALSTPPQKKVAVASTGHQKKVAVASTGPQKKVASITTKSPKHKITPQDFVSFSLTDTPKPVFVKSVKSKEHKISSKMDIQSKKVTFSLNKNMTTEFKRSDRSLLVSPTGSSRVPFNPEQKPQHGVLKTPTKRSAPRPQAKDFF